MKVFENCNNNKKTYYNINKIYFYYEPDYSKILVH